MDLRDLVRTVLDGNLILARQLVADAQRTTPEWRDVEQPVGLTDDELSVAAALAELLASRAGSMPPAWTQSVGPALEMIVLDPGLEQMPRSFAHAKNSGPESLRSRNLIALPDFLSVA